LLNYYKDEELALDFPNDTCWDEFLSKFTTKSKNNIESKIFKLNIRCYVKYIKYLIQGNI